MTWLVRPTYCLSFEVTNQERNKKYFKHFSFARFFILPFSIYVEKTILTDLLSL